MAAKKRRISEKAVELFYREEDYAGEIEGVSFADLHDTGDFDGHGGRILMLVVKDDEGQLYGGELTVHAGEGEIYEFPRELVPVERSERTVVVVDYIPIG